MTTYGQLNKPNLTFLFFLLTGDVHIRWLSKRFIEGFLNPEAPEFEKNR